MVKDAAATKLFGLGDVPLSTAAAGDAKPNSSARTSPTRATCALLAAEGAGAPLPNLKRIPVLIVVAEASYHAAYDHCTRPISRRRLCEHAHRPADAGVRGNGHISNSRLETP